MASAVGIAPSMPSVRTTTANQANRVTAQLSSNEPTVARCIVRAIPLAAAVCNSTPGPERSSAFRRGDEPRNTSRFPRCRRVVTNSTTANSRVLLVDGSLGCLVESPTAALGEIAEQAGEEQAMRVVPRHCGGIRRKTAVRYLAGKAAGRSRRELGGTGDSAIS